MILCSCICWNMRKEQENYKFQLIRVLFFWTLILTAPFLNYTFLRGSLVMTKYLHTWGYFAIQTHFFPRKVLSTVVNITKHESTSCSPELTLFLEKIFLHQKLSFHFRRFWKSGITSRIIPEIKIILIFMLSFKIVLLSSVINMIFWTWKTYLFKWGTIQLTIKNNLIK